MPVPISYIQFICSNPQATAEQLIQASTEVLAERSANEHRWADANCDRFAVLAFLADRARQPLPSEPDRLTILLASQLLLAQLLVETSASAAAGKLGKTPHEEEAVLPQESRPDALLNQSGPECASQVDSLRPEGASRVESGLQADLPEPRPTSAVGAGCSQSSSSKSNDGVSQAPAFEAEGNLYFCPDCRQQTLKQTEDDGFRCCACRSTFPGFVIRQMLKDAEASAGRWLERLQALEKRVAEEADDSWNLEARFGSEAEKLGKRVSSIEHQLDQFASQLANLDIRCSSEEEQHRAACLLGGFDGRLLRIEKKLEALTEAYLRKRKA